jgi:hypothetical protein
MKPGGSVTSMSFTMPTGAPDSSSGVVGSSRGVVMNSNAVCASNGCAPAWFTGFPF